jgi:hypothetical protein
VYISWRVLRRRGWDSRDCAINVAYGMSGFSAGTSGSGGGVGVMEDVGVEGSSEDSRSKGSCGIVP